MFFSAPVWPIRWNAPYHTTIDRIAALGFKGVELIGWNAEAYESYYTKETIASLRAQIDGLGLTLTNFNFTPEGLSSPDEKRRVASRDTYKRAVETAAALGAKTLTSVSCHPFGRNDAFEPLQRIPTKQIWTTLDGVDEFAGDWSDNFELYAAEVHECCRLAAGAGLKVLIEPHPYRWVNSAQSMLRLIEHVGADNLGMNFDPSHLFPSGDMPQLTVYQMRGRLWHTHFSDNDSLTNAHWRTGMGKIDWTAVMRALKDIGYDYAISIELEDVPGTATAQTEATAAFDRELTLCMAHIAGICDELGIPLER